MGHIYAFKFKQIGLKIVYYRKLRNISQRELAKRINISVSALGKIERGTYNNNLSMSMLFTIAEGLGIDPVLLLTFDKREEEFMYSNEFRHNKDTKADLEM